MKMQTLQKVVMIILATMCVVTGFTWGHARLYIYHSQSRLLAPADYLAEVIPVSSGVPDNRQAEFRKTDNGQYYVHVNTLGTAHYIDLMTPYLLGQFFLALSGYIVCVWIQRKQFRDAGVLN